MPGLKNKVAKSYLLADKSQSNLAAENSDDGLVIQLPTGIDNRISTTVVLQVKEPLHIDKLPEPVATASNVYGNDTADWGPQFAFDGNDGTRWATDDATKQAWVALNFPKSKTFHHVRISEAYAGRVQKFEFQYRDGDDWKTIFEGTIMGENFQKDFAPVTAREFRLNVLDATTGPTINDIDLN